MLILLSLFALAASQQIGTHEVEAHPEMPLWTCDAGGCTKEMKSIVLDANWRWLHNGQYTNCYKDGDWDSTLCPDPVTCAANCHLEGNSEKQYKSTYGIKTIEDGVQLGFVTTTKYGSNFGSRVYMLDDENTYKMFKLKNREFTLTAQMRKMFCVGEPLALEEAGFGDRFPPGLDREVKNTFIHSAVTPLVTPEPGSFRRSQSVPKDVGFACADMDKILTGHDTACSVAPSPAFLPPPTPSSPLYTRGYEALLLSQMEQSHPLNTVIRLAELI